MSLLFVVDGVAERRSQLQYALERSGYSVETCPYSQVLEAAMQRRPVAFVIAMDSPGGSGIDLCRRLRRYPQLSTAGMVLVADSKKGKYRAALDSTVDQCLSFPLAPGEIAFAVEEAIRNRANSDYLPAESDNMLVINASTMRVAVSGREICTTPLEFRLINYLARHHGQEFSRDALLDAVWGDLLFVTPRSVDSCVRRIRRKLEPKACAPIFLKSIRGVGYRLDAKPIWEADEPCQCATCSDAQQRKSGTYKGEQKRDR